MPEQIAISYSTVGFGQLGSYTVPIISNADRISLLASPPAGAWVAWAPHGESHSSVLVVPQQAQQSLPNGELTTVISGIFTDLSLVVLLADLNNASKKMLALISLLAGAGE